MHGPLHRAFLTEAPLAVPWEVVQYLAEQLGIEDASWVKKYAEREATAYEHSWEIQRRFHYVEFDDRDAGRRFRSFPPTSARPTRSPSASAHT
jgi:hypothetical protein